MYYAKIGAWFVGKYWATHSKIAAAKFDTTSEAMEHALMVRRLSTKVLKSGNIEIIKGQQ